VIEEHMIHMLLKHLDKSGEKLPYEFSVSKAIGGPSTFQNVWKSEGYKKALEKGKDDANMEDREARMRKAMGFFKT
jgi:hypothetical protein